jgi:hypothetical protein
MKSDAEHRVPLSKPARAVLDRRRIDSKLDREIVPHGLPVIVPRLGRRARL